MILSAFKNGEISCFAEYGSLNCYKKALPYNHRKSRAHFHFLKLKNSTNLLDVESGIIFYTSADI